MLQVEVTPMDPNDPVAFYVREASAVETLTNAEETKLLRELGISGE
jgi:hypothetical protein